jgi:hypothetical protein
MTTRRFACDDRLSRQALFPSQRLQRAPYPSTAGHVQHVRVDHRRPYVRVAQQLLNRLDLVASSGDARQRNAGTWQPTGPTTQARRTAARTAFWNPGVFEMMAANHARPRRTLSPASSPPADDAACAREARDRAGEDDRVRAGTERVALNACACVEAATSFCVVRSVRKALTSSAPIESGWRLLKRINRRIQPTYASSVGCCNAACESHRERGPAADAVKLLPPCLPSSLGPRHKVRTSTRLGGHSQSVTSHFSDRPLRP